MIFLVLRAELCRMRRDGRLRTACWCAGALLVAAAAVGASEAASRRLGAARAAAVSYQQWLAQGDDDPHSATHFGLYAFKPRTALSFFDPGIEPFVGSMVLAESHHRNEPQGRAMSQATSLCRFPSLTPAFIAQTLVPLLILAMAFPLAAGDREKGTWDFSLASGASSWTLAAGKALAVMAGVGAVMAPAAAVCTAVMIWIGPDDAGTAWRGILLLSIYGAYYAALSAAFVAVSACFDRARSAFVACLTLWAVGFLWSPRLVMEAAAIAHPLAPAEVLALDLETRREAAAPSGQPPTQRQEQIKRELMLRHGVSREQDLPLNLDGVMFEEGERLESAVAREHMRSLWSIYDRRDGFVRAASALLPLLALRELSMSLSGTDWRRHRLFLEAAEGYRVDLVQKMNHALATGKPGAPGGGKTLWRQVEPFRFQEPSLSMVLRQGALLAAALLAWSAAAVALLRWTAGRAARP